MKSNILLYAGLGVALFLAYFFEEPIFSVFELASLSRHTLVRRLLLTLSVVVVYFTGIGLGKQILAVWSGRAR